jgi:hypothetical protein
MARAFAPLHDLGGSGLIAIAPHLLVERSSRRGLALWRVTGDGEATRFVLAGPVADSAREGA